MKKGGRLCSKGCPCVTCCVLAACVLPAVLQPRKAYESFDLLSALSQVLTGEATQAQTKRLRSGCLLASLLSRLDLQLAAEAVHTDSHNACAGGNGGRQGRWLQGCT